MDPQIISSLCCALVGLIVSLVPYLVLENSRSADRCASSVSATVLLFAAFLRSHGPPQDLEIFPQLLLGNALAALAGHLLGQAIMRLRMIARPLPQPL